MSLLASIVLALTLTGPLASGWAFNSNSRAPLTSRADTALLFGEPTLSLKSLAFGIPAMSPALSSPELASQPEGCIVPGPSDDSEDPAQIDGSPEYVRVGPDVNVRPQQVRLGVIGKDEWSGSALFGPRPSLRGPWKPEDLERSTSAPGSLHKKKTVRLSAAGPEVDVSYSHAGSNNAPQPAYVAPVPSGADTVEAGLSFSRSDWTARVLSSYTAGEDLWLNGTAMRERGHALSGSYRFTDSVTLAPSLAYREVSAGWSAVRTDTPSASLSVTYVPLRDLKLATVGSYSRTVSTDRLIDRDAYQIKTEMSLTTRGSSSIETTISIDGGYQASKDRFSASGPMEDLSGFLRLRISGL